MADAEDGSITPLLAVGMACCVLLSGFVAAAGDRLVKQQRAQIIADASALAAIYGGISSAERVAQTNGAQIVDFDEYNNEVAVTVLFASQSAAAQAVDTWAPTSPTLEP